MVDMDPRDHYDEHAERERGRLDETPVKRLEFEGTVATLEDHLPEAGRVLDAGGGPGRYSVWLAEQGYEVVHCDPSSELVELAAEDAREAGFQASVEPGRGDVRRLPYREDTFDAVCCLGGVLSHVVEETERRRAAAELRRVARPCAPVFVSVIGRLGAVRFGMKANAEGESTPADWDVLEHIARTGDYTESVVERYGAEAGWAENHTFRVAELESLLDEAGLTPHEVVALEGVASTLHEELDGAPEHVVETIREIARLHRHDRAVADVSEHFLVVAEA